VGQFAVDLSVLSRSPLTAVVAQDKSWSPLHGVGRSWQRIVRMKDDLRIAVGPRDRRRACPETAPNEEACRRWSTSASPGRRFGAVRA
jgi:hypothetical protein